MSWLCTIVSPSPLVAGPGGERAAIRSRRAARRSASVAPQTQSTMSRGLAF